ncbi:hypothetical protein CEXT_810381, partial [Caerostris extrusa]
TQEPTSRLTYKRAVAAGLVSGGDETANVARSWRSENISKPPHEIEIKSQLRSSTQRMSNF